MLITSAYPWVAAVLLGLSPAPPGFATETPYSGDLGTAKWFDMMRQAGQNSAMLRALAGSNGQSVVPPDCVEISGVIISDRGDAYKGKVPNVRIVSADDRVDNVPRSPFIFQGSGPEPPNFYTVLKRDLNYDFYWQDDKGRDERFAVWKAPADGAKQIRLIFALDAGGKCKISVYTEQRRAAK
jgi:hypothetical protein